MKKFKPSEYDCFDEKDDDIFEKAEQLTNKFRNKEGVPEFKSDDEFKQYLQDLMSIGGNTVSPVKTLCKNDQEELFTMIVKCK